MDKIDVNIPSVKVLSSNVLVKQTMRKKDTRIIMDAAESDKDKFDYAFEIIAKGDECVKKFEIGDAPIFGQYVQFLGVKVIERNKHGMVSHVIVDESHIIAVDLNPEKVELPSETESSSENSGPIINPN